MRITYREAITIATAPKSRFWFGSPCRFIPRVDFTCHLLVPQILRKGDISQGGLWDRARVALSVRLMSTSPRWQHLVGSMA